MERRPGYFPLHTQVVHSQLTLHLEETSVMLPLRMVFHQFILSKNTF